MRMAKTPDANAPAGKTSTAAEEENRDGKRAAAPGEKTKGTLDFLIQRAFLHIISIDFHCQPVSQRGRGISGTTAGPVGKSDSPSATGNNSQILSGNGIK